MIPLVLRAVFAGSPSESVVRATVAPSSHPDDALICQCGPDVSIGQEGWSATLRHQLVEDLAGDVLLLQPQRGAIQRLIRVKSKHNTLLVTEQCDQLCVMCSQPPRKKHHDQFQHFKVAAMLAPPNAVIGLSGGEPTLHKSGLFDLLDFALTLRPDLRFHVLSNGQHFDEADGGFLSSEAARRIQWGVPLYAADPTLHDRIVGKVGAFDQLMAGLAILCRSGAHVELRTVIMRENVEGLPSLARFIATHVPFADPWAIMQVEKAGYAKNRWSELFFDHSRDFSALAAAIEITKLHGLPTFLYNFPLCTVPAAYRRIAPSTISDWKRRYEPVCANCVAKPFCGGFFEWHPSDDSYERLGLQ